MQDILSTENAHLTDGNERREPEAKQMVKYNFAHWYRQTLVFFLLIFVVQLQLCAFSPHPSTPPQPNPPPSPTSTLPLDFVHVSKVPNFFNLVYLKKIAHSVLL